LGREGEHSEAAAATKHAGRLILPAELTDMIKPYEIGDDGAMN
jgi:hypothetical protein